MDGCREADGADGGRVHPSPARGLIRSTAVAGEPGPADGVSSVEPPDEGG